MQRGNMWDVLRPYVAAALALCALTVPTIAYSKESTSQEKLLKKFSGAEKVYKKDINGDGTDDHVIIYGTENGRLLEIESDGKKQVSLSATDFKMKDIDKNGIYEILVKNKDEKGKWESKIYEWQRDGWTTDNIFNNSIRKKENDDKDDEFDSAMKRMCVVKAGKLYDEWKNAVDLNYVTSDKESIHPKFGLRLRFNELSKMNIPKYENHSILILRLDEKAYVVDINSAGAGCDAFIFGYDIGHDRLIAIENICGGSSGGGTIYEFGDPSSVELGILDYAKYTNECEYIE